MEITLHHSTRELVEAMSQFEPSTQFVTSSLTYLRGELAPEQSRTEAEYHTVYALVQGDNPPPDIYPVVNDALIRYAAELSTRTNMYLTTGQIAAAQKLGCQVRRAELSMVKLFAGSLEPDGEPVTRMVVRYPVKLNPTPTNLAVAYALYHQTPLTPTVRAEGPATQLTGLNWTTEEGTRHRAEAPLPEQLQMPHKVKSISLQISADGSEYHLDSPFFISADLQLTTARDYSLDTEQLQNLLMEAYRQRRPATEFPPEDIALATALAHTMPTDQAIETYGRYVTERYLHEPTEIIRRVGKERLYKSTTAKEALQGSDNQKSNLTSNGDLRE